MDVDEDYHPMEEMEVDRSPSANDEVDASMDDLIGQFSGLSMVYNNSAMEVDKDEMEIDLPAANNEVDASMDKLVGLVSHLSF
mmetsp:Transcript_36409/g.88177  ORF Transcript_36409/g.88177 Transcript_36409/m.88177 type:complete len:83 (-) Transcript_36409:158-406(-)